MSKIAAFVGHSFTDNDKEVVDKFLAYFDTLTDMGIGFSWEHAEKAEPKILSQKVKETMEGKNLFIGICTEKENIIDKIKLKNCPFDKKSMKAKIEDFNRKCSDWIIQEIGYALGRDMDLILLLENNLRRPGGLQSDVEHITFNRSEPEKTFKKILEMITSLMPKREISAMGQVDKPSEENEVKDLPKSDDKEKLEITSEWTQGDYDYELFLAIIHKDKDREDEISKNYKLNLCEQDEFKQISWELRRLYHHHTFLNENTLDKIKYLLKKNPKHSGVHYYLGQIYEDYKNYKVATDHYKMASDLANDDKNRLFYLCKEAVSISKSGDFDLAKITLEDAKRLKDKVENGDLTILNTYLDISELEKRDDKFVIFSEGSLNYNPDDHTKRFSLAYKYSNIQDDSLAIYHYQILCEKNPNSTNWNNLGVAQERLKLNYKSVESYQKSKDLDGTLAMSNLAKSLIQGGFLNEAEKICNDALQFKNYDKRVAGAISEIRNVKDYEKSEEQKILQKLEPRRLFMIEYAKACTKKTLSEINYVFEGPNCPLEIKIKKWTIELSGTFTQNVAGLGIPTPGFSGINVGAHVSYIGQSRKSPKAMKILYKGDILGHSIKFKKYVYEQKMLPTLLSSEGAEGLMIISDDLSLIKVYEKGDEKIDKFYELKRKE